MGLNWESSQEERRCKKVAGHRSDSDTSTETTLAEQRQCPENALCDFRMGSQGFSCWGGAWWQGGQYLQPLWVPGDHTDMPGTAGSQDHQRREELGKLLGS